MSESNRDARECGLKTRGLRSTLELEAGKFYRGRERLADQTAWPTLRPNRHFASLQDRPIMPADSMALGSFNPSIPVCRERVVSVQRQDDPAACVFANQTKLLLSRLLAKSVAVGDEITFSIPAPDAVGPEIFVTKNAASGPSRYLYQAPIGYVSQPKQDKRNRYLRLFRGSTGRPSVSARFSCLARSYASTSIACRVRPTNRSPHSVQYAYPRQRFARRASRSFQTAGSGAKTAWVSASSQRVALERSFNIVGQPELRACYDALLLADPETPAIFPYGGFGSLLVAGEPPLTEKPFLPVAS